MKQVADVGAYEDVEYDAFLKRVEARFAENVRGGDEPLFMTAADHLPPNHLFSLYLCALPVDRAQHHNCQACRKFINTFGGLVTISDDGKTHSAMWHEDDAPDELKESVAAVRHSVERLAVTGVFKASERVCGTPVTKEWHHLALSLPAKMLVNSTVKTAFQQSAEKSEDFKTVLKALSEFTIPMLEQAVKLLKTDSLYRSEKVLGQAEWLLNLQNARGGRGGNKSTNVIWKAIATAPAGFCHPRASMIGTLLEDIAAGMNFDLIAKRFAAKMHPLQYQRPTAPPSDGVIAQAEVIFQKLNAAGSLARRYCRLDEVKKVWSPSPKKEEASKDGLFGHLKSKSSTKDVADIQMPAVKITWDKFRRTVLPEAETIELFVPHQPDNYGALVTAVNPDAPPILQWDLESARNPVSTYVWHGGSFPSQFGLESQQFHQLDCICFGPPQWGDEDAFAHHSNRIMLIINGAKESRMAGAAIFPENLRSEFHEIRSVIESYSRRSTIEGNDEPHACGLILSKGNEWGTQIRVTSKGLKTLYKLDRWD